MKTNCEYCNNYVYDEYFDYYVCDVNLDEDEMFNHWSTIQTCFGITNFRYNFVKMLGNITNIPCAFA